MFWSSGETEVKKGFLNLVVFLLQYLAYGLIWNLKSKVLLRKEVPRAVA